MLPRTYWSICVALCAPGCVAQVDFSGLDAGASTGGQPSVGEGGSSGLGGALNNSGGDSTLSGGTNAGTTEPCNDATCEVPVVIASNLQEPCSIAVDDTFVYWTDCTSGEVKKVPLGGGDQVTIASGQDKPEDIAVDDTYVYWTSRMDSNSGGVVRAPLGGGAPTTLASAPGQPTSMTMNATSIYWASVVSPVYPDTGSAVATIFSVPIGGGTPTAVVSEDGYVSAQALDGTNIYWTNQRADDNGDRNMAHGYGAVKKMPLSSGTPIILASAQNEPVSIAVDATNVYWSHFYPATLKSVPIEGGTPTVLASETPSELVSYSIVLDSTYAYWIAGGGETMIDKAPLGGGTLTRLYSLPGHDGASCLAMDATSIYWGNISTEANPTGIGTVMKLRLH